MSGSDTYLFMSQPRPVETRKKYRPVEELEEELGNTANIMFDPRVIRGVTCAQPDDLPAVPYEVAAQAQIRRPTKSHLVQTGKIRPTQKTVAEIHENIVVVKQRVEVPLHLYLVEQEEPVRTHVVDTQTDVFLEEPPEPEYIPRKTGVDVETQVENAEVFDFDRDVSHILEVVISKSCEQSLMEVRQEEEFRTIARTKAFLQEKSRLRDVLASEMEKVEREQLKNKEQMLMENRARAAREGRLQQKLAANVFARRYLEPLQQMVFDELSGSNYFYDPIRMNAERFTPWLTDKLGENLKHVKNSKSWISGLLSDSIAQIALNQEESYEGRRLAIEKKKAEEAEEQRKKEEEAKQKRLLKLTIDSAACGKIGPISTRANFLSRVLLDKMHAHLEETRGEGGDDEGEFIPVRQRMKLTHKEGTPVEDDRPLYELDVDSLVLVVETPPTPPPDEGDEGDEGDKGGKEETKEPEK